MAGCACVSCNIYARRRRVGVQHHIMAKFEQAAEGADLYLRIRAEAFLRSIFCPVLLHLSRLQVCLASKISHFSANTDVSKRAEHLITDVAEFKHNRLHPPRPFRRPRVSLSPVRLPLLSLETYRIKTFIPDPPPMLSASREIGSTRIKGASGHTGASRTSRPQRRQRRERRQWA